MYVCQNDRELCESETASSSTMENEKEKWENVRGRQLQRQIYESFNELNRPNITGIYRYNIVIVISFSL